MTLLTGEVKDKGYTDPPRQQEALYAHSADQYLKADVDTGKHYYDLNAASKSYAGPWLFGKENVQVTVDRRQAQWLQWCPIPADLRDGVFLRGNVIYENPNGTYRMSTDLFEGVLRTEGRRRYFVGRTQHTFYGRDLPDGQLKVIAQLNICLDKRLAHNPMMIPPTEGGTNAYTPQNYTSSPNYTPATYAPQNYPQQPRSYQPPTYQPTPNYPQPQTYQQPQNYPAPQSYPAPQGYSQQQGYPQQSYQQQYPPQQYEAPQLRGYPANKQPLQYETKPEIRF